MPHRSPIRNGQSESRQRIRLWPIAFYTRFACSGFNVDNSGLVFDKHRVTRSLPREASGSTVSPNVQSTYPRQYSNTLYSTGEAMIQEVSVGQLSVVNRYAELTITSGAMYTVQHCSVYNHRLLLVEASIDCSPPAKIGNQIRYDLQNHTRNGIDMGRVMSSGHCKKRCVAIRQEINTRLYNDCLAWCSNAARSPIKSQPCCIVKSTNHLHMTNLGSAPVSITYQGHGE
ncbi:hypothetical protein BU25DRAFT_77552 [Macroventuria anomochaeta]|uniref:Uncharacterized protein n=1 Tax=Macroventuria anomochaeta TaxID=301207 RepID=A0ACB6SF31_9PLEO|nr:uncharacterized protein BU25DRAFT_77552 [Macroventuria anomochaeta]KAF2632578.1 hypothetical protein BU25DRAFT_77552 [Macroventuria anomochaeta]